MLVQAERWVTHRLLSKWLSGLERARLKYHQGVSMCVGTLRERGSHGQGLRLELVSFQISNWKVSALVWKERLLKRYLRGVIIVWESFPAGPGGETTLRSRVPLPRIYAAAL